MNDDIWNNTRLGKVLGDLCDITRECREDMHEPDEQSLTAVVKGKSFDNAMGDETEKHLVLTRRTRTSTEVVTINLCDLIALARKAVPTLPTLICHKCGKRVPTLVVVEFSDLDEPKELCIGCWEEFGEVGSRPRIHYIRQRKCVE
jgi:hypothetical protein